MQLSILLSLLALARAGALPAAPAVLAKLEDFDPAPHYSFAYDVQDSITGDSKAQYETRNGDLVQGSYSLIEADGTRRIVDYTADDVNGFNAVVNREPAVAVAPVVARTAVAPAPVIARAPIVGAPGAFVAQYPAAAPAVARFAAPLTYAAAGYVF